jgi:hypothetical protein
MSVRMRAAISNGSDHGLQPSPFTRVGLIHRTQWLAASPLRVINLIDMHWHMTCSTPRSIRYAQFALIPPFTS